MEFIIIFVLTLLNGFFALSEIALVSVKKSRMEHLVKKWDHRAKIVLELKENPETFLSSVQVGITLIGIIAGAYGGSALAEDMTPYFATLPYVSAYAETLALVIAITSITYFSIVIGELVPKSLAMNNPESFALLSVPILRYFMKLTHPFVHLLSLSTSIILRILGIKEAPEERLSEDELRSLLKNAGKQGVLDTEESRIHHNIFSFGDQKAKSIITHRNEIEWIDIKSNAREIFDTIKNSTHSKFVVADGSLDTVVGIMRLRDFLENQDRVDFSLAQIISKPIILSEHTPAPVILNTFRKKKQYIAIIKDEFWGTEGIITLHDLIEVIVGDLPDENDDFEPNIISRNQDEYLINGKTLIYEMNQFFQEEVIEDRSHEYTTLSGYIMHTLGKLPKTGEIILGNRGYQFEIMDIDGIRIDKVLMKKMVEREEI